MERIKIIDDYIQDAKDLEIDFVSKIKPKQIVFDSRVILKCYNCQHYGKKMTCPPNIPNIDYKEMVYSYENSLILALKNNFKTEAEFNKIRIESSNKLLSILLELEKIAFNDGNYFTQSFAAGSCKLCKECINPCRFPEKSRIAIEGIGIDVVSTVKKVGLNVQFPIKDYFYRIGLFLIN